LPDESIVRGTSYAVGQRYTISAAAATDPRRRPQVTIEYNPSDPRVNRIKGMRTSPFGPWVLVVALFPAVGLAIAIAGFSSGRSQLWLLRHGQFTIATIASCRLVNAQGRRAASIQELRHAWKSRAVARAIPAWFVKLYGGGTIVMFVIGVLFCVGMIGGALVNKIDVGSASKATFVGLFSGFLVIWVAVMSFLLAGAKRLRAVAAGKSSLEGLHARAQCTFEYRLPDHRTVKAKQTVTITSQLGAGTTEPALYDPARPVRAMLYNGLAVPASVDLSGRLVSMRSWEGIIRMGFVSMSLIGPVVLWTMWPRLF
jgi:hypothetical protein